MVFFQNILQYLCHNTIFIQLIMITTHLPNLRDDNIMK